MIKIMFFTVILTYSFGYSQTTTIKDKYETSQAQDFSVPPPPKITFPAQYPGGNRTFLNEIKNILSINQAENLKKNCTTKIIVKVDSDGNVVNVSTYGTDQNFNREVKKAALLITNNKKWNPGENAKGVKVIDIVNIPFKY